jgi:alpha-1,3-rhamnosyl/mannosyltransferase
MTPKERQRVLRVIINQLATAGKKTGVGHYSAQLFRHLRAHAGPDQIAGYPGLGMRCVRNVWAGIYPYLEGGIRDIVEGNHALSRWRGRLRQSSLRTLRGWGRTIMARHVRQVLAKQSFDVYHEPNFLPLPIDVPTLATFHDLSVLLHPEWHPADRVAHFEHHLPHALEQCVHFITVSEFSRQEVIRTLNVPAANVTRIYNGIRGDARPVPEWEVQRVLRKLGLPPRYLLYVGTLEPRKNVLRLLKAYCALDARLRDEWPLLLVGTWGWRFLEIADYLYHDARHRGVIHVGYVPDGYLPAIYTGARALLYPSLYEGFGLPPLEMLACGGAVLTSTAGALVETVGAYAHQLDPLDVDAWRQAIARVATDDDWWRHLRGRARGAAMTYCWDRCARETLALYRRIHESQTSFVIPMSDDRAMLAA